MLLKYQDFRLQANQVVHYLKRFYLGFWIEAERQGVSLIGLMWGRTCLNHLHRIVGVQEGPGVR